MYPRFLVKGVGSGGNPLAGSKRPDEKVWVILWADTPILARNGRRLPREALRLGSTVSVWADGRNRDRDPDQAGASYMIVEEA